MDTFSGSLQAWSLMTLQYNALEGRYILPLSDFESNTVHLSSLLEILVQAPLCLWVYYLIVHQGNSALRYAVEFCLCTLQMAGTWYFYLPLLLTPSNKRLMAMLGTDDVIDFYFRGIFGSILCPAVWIVVPMLRIYLCTQSLDASLKSKSDSQIRGSFPRRIY